MSVTYPDGLFHLAQEAPRQTNCCVYFHFSLCLSLFLPLSLFFLVNKVPHKEDEIQKGVAPAPWLLLSYCCCVYKLPAVSCLKAPPTSKQDSNPNAPKNLPTSSYPAFCYFFYIYIPFETCNIFLFLGTLGQQHNMQNRSIIVCLQPTKVSTLEFR